MNASAGLSLKDSQIRQDLGIIIAAIKKPDGKMLFSPPPETVIAVADVLITLGNRKQLDRLEKMAGA